jgi:predicted nucleic acid-binding protein
MAAPQLVLVDTCIWVQFFNRPQSAYKLAVDALLEDDRAAIVGPILSEILLGFRRDEQADWEASVLRGLHHIQPAWDEWRAAAQLGRGLRATGHHLPLSDLVIGAVAMERGISVYTTDPHFDLMAKVMKYSA